MKFIHACIYLFCDLQTQHCCSLYSLSWDLIHSLVSFWTFFLRTTIFVNQRQGILALGKEYFLQGYHKLGSAGLQSPAFLKDLPGRGNCKLILTSSSLRGKKVISTVWRVQSAKFATPLFSPSVS